MADDIVILNDVLTQRTSATGKQRVTISVRSEPIVHDLDPRRMAEGPALAIAALFRERVSGITAVASQATLRARAVAAKAFAAGESWAMRRYSGGKIGPMAPNQSDRAFNDSGRLAKSIVAQARDDEWRINVAGNRFQAADVKGGQAGITRIWDQLVALVPEFGNPAMLMDDLRVRKAIEEGKKVAIVKEQARSEALDMGRARAVIGLARAGWGLLRAVAG